MVARAGYRHIPCFEKKTVLDKKIFQGVEYGWFFKRIIVSVDLDVQLVQMCRCVMVMECKVKTGMPFIRTIKLFFFYDKIRLWTFPVVKIILYMSEQEIN